MVPHEHALLRGSRKCKSDPRRPLRNFIILILNVSLFLRFPFFFYKLPFIYLLSFSPSPCRVRWLPSWVRARYWKFLKKAAWSKPFKIKCIVQRVLFCVSNVFKAFIIAVIGVYILDLRVSSINLWLIWSFTEMY